MRDGQFEKVGGGIVCGIGVIVVGAIAMCFGLIGLLIFMALIKAAAGA